MSSVGTGGSAGGTGYPKPREEAWEGSTAQPPRVPRTERKPLRRQERAVETLEGRFPGRHKSRPTILPPQPMGMLTDLTH